MRIANEVIIANITLYAKWNAVVNYTITFNSNSGSEIQPIHVAQGSKAAAPAPPTRDGYIFAGWYKEASLTNEFVFANEIITANIMLYAKWTQPTPGVPIGLTATTISKTQIDLSWTATTGATKYNLFDGATQIGGDITGTKYSHTGLTQSSSHSYTLKACNAAGGCSAISAAVRITTLP